MDLGARIAAVEFRLGLGGYNVEEVDRFLTGLTDRIERGDTVTAAALHGASFRPSLKGYNVHEVDQFVQAIATELAPG